TSTSGVITISTQTGGTVTSDLTYGVKATTGSTNPPNTNGIVIALGDTVSGATSGVYAKDTGNSGIVINSTAAITGTATHGVEAIGSGGPIAIGSTGGGLSGP